MSTRVAMGGRQFAAWIGIAMLVLYLALAGGGGVAGILVLQFRVASLVLVTVTLGTWLVLAWRAPRWRPASVMWRPIVTIMAAFVVTSILSWNQRLSLEFLAYGVLLLSLYLLLVRLFADERFRPRLLVLVAFLCGTIAVLYLGITLQYWIDWWALVGHLAVPPLRPGFEGLSFGNPSTVAAIGVLLLAPATAALVHRGRTGNIAIAILVLLVGPTVVVSGSRGAWLALGLAVVVTAVLGLLRPGTRLAIRHWLERTPRAALAAVAVVGTIGAVGVGPAMIVRIVQGGGDNLRFVLNMTAIRMFAEDPLTGSGPGTWVVRRAAFTQPQEVDYYIPHAHNVFTQGLAEFGLVGVAAAIIALIAILSMLRDAITSDQAIRRSMGWATVFSLTYFAGHQLVDMQMYLPGIMFAAILPVAFLDGMSAKSAPDATKSVSRVEWLGSRRGGLAVIGLACLVAVGFCARIESIAWNATEASYAGDRGDWARAARLAQAAVAADPDLPANGFIAGLALARDDSQTARQAALALMRRSAEQDDFPQAWLNVASLELDAGNSSAARDALDRAMRLGWQQAAVSLPAGVLYLQLEDEAAAQAAIRDALVVAPELTDDPFWESNPALATIRDAVVEDLLFGGGSTAMSMALMLNRIEEARALVATLPAGDQEVAVLVIDAWEGDSAARDEVASIAETRPLDPGPVIWSAVLADRDGDIDAKNRFRRWAAIMGGSLGTAIGEDVVVTDRPRVRSQVPGSPANFQGLYTYRRPYPWDLLVPSLPKLTKE